jgi:transposase
MIDRRTVFEIHRLKNLGFAKRKIARELGLDRDTVRKYLKHPERVVLPKLLRTSKLDPYRDLIDQFLESDPYVKAPVVLQRLCENGFDGKISIVRDYLRKKRGKINNRKSFIRFESPPGKQMQIDWGHFGSLTYGNTRRKLYAMAVVECYSRMLYVEFTHSQKQESLHQVLLNAFEFFGGTPDEIVVDNMLTAVTERLGRVIRFNDAFLDFLRVFKIVPFACNVRAPHEKGKIERAIGYIRQNFWPLRKFTDQDDVQNQANQWRDNIANVRVHQTTGEVPIDRFARVNLRPLPEPLPDCREVCSLKVYKDFAVKFDGNTYTVPPRVIGKLVTLKANRTTITIYDQEKRLAAHTRCWERKKRIELPSHQEQVKKMSRKLWQDRDIVAFISLGHEAEDYLKALADAGQPVRKNIARLLSAKDEYGAFSLIQAIKKALEYKAYGADYIENILYQEMTPKRHHQAVKVKDRALNRIRLTEPSLADYDSYVLTKRKSSNDEDRN